jgi:predicted DNA-binding transcriptional regulator YafY
VAKATYFEVIELLELMRSVRYGVTHQMIEDRFHRGKRTAQRWIKFLLDEGWAKQATPDDQGRSRWVLTDAGQGTVPLVVSASELLAQCVAIQAAAPLVAGTELLAALQSVTHKIAGVLPRNAQHFGLEALAAFPPPPGAAQVTVRPQILEDLLEAVVRHRVIEAKYCSQAHGGEPKTLKLRPLAVFPHKGVLYLAGIGGDNPEKKRPFYWAVHRFEDATITRETFAPPKGFNAREFVQRSFGAFDGEVLDVHVRFSPEITRQVSERTVHPSQQITRNKDGSIDVRFRASGWPEIKGWILGYGKYAELLAPKDKRKELARELADAAKQYQ